MKIEVNKNLLAGALSALGKLISRTSPLEAYRSIQIKCKENVLHFRTAGAEESIEFKMEAITEGDFSAIIEFEPFRQVVRNSRNKSLVFEADENMLRVDGIAMISVSCDFPEALETPPEGAATEILPGNFVELLNIAAPIVNRNDYRKQLQGINLSRDGITTTNGKELFNAPVPMNVESLTLPFPLALITTRASGMTKLNYWTDGVSIYFQIAVADWIWSGKAVTGMYPNWKQVIPANELLTHSVTLNADTVEHLKIWLKAVPDNPPHNAVEIFMADRGTMTISSTKGTSCNLTAEFGDDWSDYKLVLNRDILLRLLNEGHIRIQCQNSSGPFLATGGVGQFIAMPLYYPTKTEEPKPVETEANPQTNETETTPENNQEENKPMVTSIPPVVSAPVQTVAIHNEPATATSVEPVNPLEELTASIESFKLKLKTIFDEAGMLSRKVREVAISQKQKERDFILAKRAIERIRMAI